MEEFGGYKCEFVSGDSTPPNQLACSLCTLMLRDPCLVDCCDAKYCRSCVNHLRAAGQQCSVCKGKLGKAEPDANLQRKVLDQKVYCSRKDTNGCKWKGKLLNLACHEDDQNECPYQPEPPHIMAEVKQMIHNMEERHKRDLKILIFMLSIIMAVVLSLLFQVRTTAMTMEQSLMSLKKEISMNVYIDCEDANQNGHTISGVYTINPDNQTEFKVYCDMDTDGGGWTVIQRRIDGSVSFDRNWAECESGFGKKKGEYWLGLSYIHRLTTSASQDLRVDLEDFEGGSAYAHYTTFTVANATDSYRMQVSGYSGTAGDGMENNSGHKFSAKDRDNDLFNGNCATVYEGPWWHNQCFHAHLNGKYVYKGKKYAEGIIWNPWKDNWHSLKTSSMKLRRQ